MALPACRRLAQVHRALAAAESEPLPPAPPLDRPTLLPEQASLSADGLILLKDHEVQRFWCATKRLFWACFSSQIQSK